MFSSLLVLLMQPVAAVEAAPLPSGPAAEATADMPAPAPYALILPKGTPIVIAIDKELGSKISQTGETFPIRLAQPVAIDGVEVLPAGITGEGQVVHAKKAGLAGAAGELVLAARWLDLDGRRIELRSFRFFEAGEVTLSKGQDNTGVSNVTTAIAGPIGFFIGGGNTNVPPGTVASAKIRNDESFAPAEAAPEPATGPQQEGME